MIKKYYIFSNQSAFAKTRTNLQGFTLLEVLVVIAIIGILASLGVVTYRTSIEKANVVKAAADIDAIHVAMGALMSDTGEWPGHQTPEEVSAGAGNEVWDLTTPEAGIVATDGSFPNWDGPYMPNIPLDAWGNSYFLDTDYTTPGGAVAPVIGSFGPNGVGQNLYDSDDIIKVAF